MTALSRWKRRLIPSGLRTFGRWSVFYTAELLLADWRAHVAAALAARIDIRGGLWTLAPAEGTWQATRIWTVHIRGSIRTVRFDQHHQDSPDDRTGLWEQEAAGSNPAIPTKSAGKRLVVKSQNCSEDHLTVV